MCVSVTSRLSPTLHPLLHRSLPTGHPLLMAIGEHTLRGMVAYVALGPFVVVGSNDGASRFSNQAAMAWHKKAYTDWPC